MASQKFLWFFLAFFIAFICSSHAATLDVGEEDGWTLHPSEDYVAWSGRLRFTVNDTLHFKYNDETDSVLVVDKDDYDNCTVDNPIEKLDGGNNKYELNEPGPNYFITGNKSNCEQGQKLEIDVLHLRHDDETESPAPAASTPPAPAPLPPAPASPITATPPPSVTTPLVTPPASSPTGGSTSSSPVGSNPADVNSPPPAVQPSSATPVVSGTITALSVLVTMLIALGLIN